MMSSPEPDLNMSHTGFVGDLFGTQFNITEAEQDSQHDAQLGPPNGAITDTVAPAEDTAMTTPSAYTPVHLPAAANTRAGNRSLSYPISVSDMEANTDVQNASLRNAMADTENNLDLYQTGSLTPHGQDQQPIATSTEKSHEDDAMDLDPTAISQSGNTRPYEDASSLFVRGDTPETHVSVEQESTNIGLLRPDGIFQHQLHQLETEVSNPQNTDALDGSNGIVEPVTVNGEAPGDDDAQTSHLQHVDILGTPNDTVTPISNGQDREIEGGNPLAPREESRAHAAPKPRTGQLMLEKIRKMQKLQKKQKSNRVPAVLNRATASIDPDIEMHDAQEDHEAALNEFQRQQKIYNDKKRQGKFNFADEIAWMRIQSTEDARKRKQKQDEQRAREEAGQGQQSAPRPTFSYADHLQHERNAASALDGPDAQSDALNDTDEDEELLDTEAGPSRKRPRAQVPRKTSKVTSYEDLLRQSLMVAIDAEEDMPQSKKKPRTEVEKPTSKGKGKGKEKASIGRVTRSKAKATKEAQPGKSRAKGAKKGRTTKQKGPRMNDVNSLFTSNVFHDQAGNDTAPDQPTFTSKRKDQALKELIASVPLEHQKAAKTDRAALLAATKDFTGHGSVKADSSNWLVKGMKTSLKPYQLLGSAFMRRRENAAEAPQGGLVADQMGLGKTLMMLANIVNGRPPKDDLVRATLLVASPVLLTQWEREINDHTGAKPPLTIMRYTASSQAKTNISYEIIQRHDFILTTYHEVMRSYPKNVPPSDCITAEQKLQWWEEVYEKFRGDLHRMQFHRVVLDEAQVIKNHSSRTSLACRGLMAKHKWALSGTPVLNTLAELYPYFKFIGVPYTGSFKVFKQNYCSSNPETTERLLVRLNQFMIRRTHKDIMFGAPILKLPKATDITHWCEFNDVERAIYDIVKRRFAEKINSMRESGPLNKQYNNILTLILRLRQMTAHILMLELTMKDLLEREDIERIKDISMDEAGNNTIRNRQIKSLRRQLADMAEKKAKEDAAKEKEKKRSEQAPESQSSTDDAEVDDPLPTAEAEAEAGPAHDEPRVDTGHDFGMSYDFSSHLKTMTTGASWEEIKQKAKCVHCYRSPPVDAFITSCHHLYCRLCLEDMQLSAAERDQDYCRCKSCGNVFIAAHRVDPDTAEGEADSQQSPSSSKGRKKKKKKDPEEDRELSNDTWIEMDGTVLPSAKTVAIKAQILNWLRENPDVKIIVYTQFLAMIRILARVCQAEGWEYIEYHGKMNFMARDKAIQTFAEPEGGKSILLASMRCGGLGLNLTMASRVIIIDPWWNHAAEQQAFCRVFRIGQEETTFMTRFCVRNTIDERLINMQERKTKEIDEVMEDDGTRFKSKMSIRDLLRLFGPIRDDKNGDPYILVNDPPPEGGVGLRQLDEDEGYGDDL